VYVTYEDGTETSLYIPLQMMWGIKANPFPSLQRKVLNPWTWADPTYSLEIPNGKKVKSITLDKTQLMADINLENNSYTHQ